MYTYIYIGYIQDIYTINIYIYINIYKYIYIDIDIDIDIHIQKYIYIDIFRYKTTLSAFCVEYQIK